MPNKENITKPVIRGAPSPYNEGYSRGYAKALELVADRLELLQCSHNHSEQWIGIGEFIKELRPKK